MKPYNHPRSGARGSVRWPLVTALALVAIVAAAVLVVANNDSSSTKSKASTTTAGTRAADKDVMAPAKALKELPLGVEDTPALHAALARHAVPKNNMKAESLKALARGSKELLSDYSNLGPLYTAGTYYPFGDTRRESIDKVSCSSNIYADLSGNTIVCHAGSARVLQATPNSDLVWLYRTVQRQDGRGGWVKVRGGIRYFGEELPRELDDVSGWFFATCGRPTPNFPYITEPNECGTLTAWHAYRPGFLISANANLNFNVQLNNQNLWTVVQDEIFYKDNDGRVKRANLYRSWVRADGTIF